MTPISDSFHACAPESLARSPTLPTSHHKVISAIQHCRSGPDGHSSMVPGGGLAEDRTTWRPSRATCSVPVKALAPMSRALFTEDMGQAGLLGQIDPLVWTTTWNVHSQAHPDGHTSCTDLAPYVVKVAISTSRIVARKNRPVTFPSRTLGSARPRTTTLDAMALLRRCLQHVVPDGFRKVRHCGCLHARCAIPPDAIRLRIAQAHPIACQPTRLVPPQQF